MAVTPTYKKKAFGPHSKIITASPGQDEYRQLHFAETSPGIWL